MARLGTLLLKGGGALLLAVVVLGGIATIASIVLSVVATVVAAVVTLSMLAVFVLALVGLVSLLGDGTEAETGGGSTLFGGSSRSADAADATDPEERLRSRYVEGELSEAEFERELDRLLEADDRGRIDSLERDRESTSDRTRLRDR